MLTAGQKDLDGKLSRAAMRDIAKVISNMNKDGKKDIVRAAWDMYATMVKEKRPIIPTYTYPNLQAESLEPPPGPALPHMTDPGQTHSDLGSTSGPSFPHNLTGVLSTKASRFLAEKD